MVEEVQARPAQVVGVQLLSKIPDFLKDKVLKDILVGIPLSPDATDPTCGAALDMEGSGCKHSSTLSPRRFPDELIRHLPNMSSSLRSLMAKHLKAFGISDTFFSKTRITAIHIERFPPVM